MGTRERQRLGAQLHRLREAAAVTLAEAAFELSWPPERILRLEAGLATIRRADFKELLSFYSADVDASLRLLEGTSGWWTQYSDELDTDGETLLILEDGANLVQSHHPGLIPGLLQTRAYTAALVGTRADQPWGRLERLVELRQERGRVLRNGSLKLVAVIDEAALRRPVGGPTVMREQYQHLISAITGLGVTIRIRPLVAEPFREVCCTFHIFKLSESTRLGHTVVQLELLDREHFEWDAKRIVRYQDAFARAQRGALDADASVEFLAELAEAC